MTSVIFYKDDAFVVSNTRFSSLIAFALEVGKTMVSTAEEKGFCIDLDNKNEKEFFNGCSLSIEKEFPQLAQQKFWVKVFYELSQRVFLRQIGNQEIEYWQASFIGDCWRLIHMLVMSVRNKEPYWTPEKFT